MITFASPSMTPALKEIWNACFGDDQAYTDFIFAHLLRPEHLLVHTADGGEPLAMLCIEPFTLVTTVGNVEGAYVFGVATRPDAQGKGLSTELLDACHERLSGDGFALSALVPASENLFRFYGKRGYETAFSVVKENYKARQMPKARQPCTLTTVPFEELQDLRDQIYARRAMYVRWEREYLAYIGAECRMLGGEVVKISSVGEAGYAVCYPTEKMVIVKEFAVPDTLRYDGLAALHERYGAERYQVYLPADTDDTANKVLPFAMVRWYDREKQQLVSRAAGGAPWIAHVLD